MSANLRRKIQLGNDLPIDVKINGTFGTQNIKTGQFNHERLEAIKALNLKIEEIEKDIIFLKNIKHKCEVSKLDCDAILNHMDTMENDNVLKFENMHFNIEDFHLKIIADQSEAMNLRVLDLKDEIFGCIEDYIVSSTPRLQNDTLKTIQSKLDSIESRINTIESKNKVNLRSRDNTIREARDTSTEPNIPINQVSKIKITTK